MQEWSKINDAVQRIDILLFDRFSNHCLANVVEPLRAANDLAQRRLYQWHICSLDGHPVASSSGLRVTPDHALAQGQGGALWIMPSYGVRDLDRPDVTQALQRVAGRYGVLGGFDTGSWLLARAGLLDGCRATIHWDELTSFAETFPQIDALRDRYVIDRSRITCSGAMAAFDLVSHLIAVDHGPLLAMDVAHLFMSREVAPTSASLPHGRTVRRAVECMQGHIEQPLSIPAIARRVGCTQKTLEARMQAALQASPSAVYRRLRLNEAHRLVRNTDQPVAEIAGRCGYENASAMTRAFRAAFRQSPREVRQQSV